MVFLLGIGLKIVLPHQIALYKWLSTIYENIAVIFIVLEIVLLVALLIHGKKIDDKGMAKISNAFATLYLSRYPFLVIVLLVPGPIRFFIAFLGLNLIPFLWLRYSFLEYAESMLKFVEDKAVLFTIYEKYNISKREQEILELILDGKSNREIAETLFIAVHTVKNHIYNVYQKLGVKKRHELVHFIIKFQKKQ